jgi:DME family drug/metabolite transporter
LNVRNRRVALIEGVIAGILFGTAAIFIKLLGILNVHSVAFWRVIIGAAVLFIIILFQKQTLRIDIIKENVKKIFPLGILIGIHFILFASAVRDTTVLNATVLVNTAPIFSMIISTLLFRIKPSRLALLGLTISFVGSGIIALGDATTSFTVNLRGDVEALLAALSEGCVSCILTRVPILFPDQIHSSLLLIGLGTLPTAIGHTLYFSSLSNLKSFETSSLALVEPLGATLLGIIFLSEMPNAFFVFGAISVLSGIGLVIIKE